MVFLLDTGLHHPDVGEDGSPCLQGFKAGPDRIMAEPHKVSHGKIPDRDRTPLTDPVFAGQISDFLPRYLTGSG
jgi:hypothetical protein